MAKINDFGKKIGGARKDVWKERGLYVSDISDWTDYEKEKLIKKNNVWPKPDYQAMYDSGIPRRVVYFIKQIRDSVPTKPRFGTEEYQNGYISFVSDLRDKTMALKSEQEVLDYYDDVMNNYVTRNGRYFAPKPETYDCLTNKLFNAAQLGRGFYYIDSAIREKQFLYTEEEKIDSFVNGHTFYKYDEATAEWETESCSGKIWLSVPYESGRTYFYVKGDDALKENWKDGTYFLDSRHRNFETLDAAKEYVIDEYKANYANDDKKTKKPSKRKKKFVPKQLENIERVGEEYRDKDVTGDDMLEVFGFYGGEFGNWLNDKDRQANLNFCYDAFCDLARALDISNEDIALNGELSIAFGARGRDASAAHYEPARRVINLTKMNGAGSLAHEWGHALDHYLGRNLEDKDDCLTNTYSDHIRNLLNTMKYKKDENGKEIETDFYRNSKKFDTLYTRTPNGYWRSDVELFARAFDCYVSDKLKENGERSDYLCGYADSYKYVNSDDTVIKAYPEGEERKRINACFDDLIEKAREKGLLSKYEREPLTLEDTREIAERRRNALDEIFATAANFGSESQQQASFDFGL